MAMIVKKIVNISIWPSTAATGGATADGSPAG
jgi:hypothetical protein